MKEGDPFHAWQRAIHLAAVATLEELRQDPKEHHYSEEQRLAALKTYERKIGFPKEEDLRELESAIKETW